MSRLVELLANIISDTRGRVEKKQAQVWTRWCGRVCGVCGCGWCAGVWVRKCAICLCVRHSLHRALALDAGRWGQQLLVLTQKLSAPADAVAALPPPPLLPPPLVPPPLLLLLLSHHCCCTCRCCHHHQTYEEMLADLEEAENEGAAADDEEEEEEYIYNPLKVGQG